MFFGSAAEEDCNCCHSREITGLTASRAEGRSPRLVWALAWSAILWLAAGFLVGSVIHGGLATTVGVPIAISVAAAAAALPVLFRSSPRQSAASSESRDSTLAVSAAFAGAMADLEDPDAAILDMLRVAAAAIGSNTALLLVLDESGTALRLVQPGLLAGRPSGPTDRTLPMAESGPIRIALAAGIPVTTKARPEDPIAWDRFRSENGIEASAVIPLTASGAQFGVMVLGTGDEIPPKSHLMRLRTITPAAGGSIGTMLRLRDLTRSTALSARTARFRADYASVVGHELRTPLTTILGVIKTLERPGMAPSNEDARDLLAMANAQGERLKRLVEDMLAINQADLDRIPIRPEMVSLPDLIDRAIGSVSGAEALTTVHIQAALPPVIIDPEHTKRVLVNLLANALKYGEESPIDIRVAVERDELVLVVSDHGPGLPPATATFAFEAFTQLKRTEVNAYGGVGLGLSISRGLIEAMGGSIRHEPTEGGGATFVARLPYRPHLGAGSSERR